MKFIRIFICNKFWNKFLFLRYFFFNEINILLEKIDCKKNLKVYKKCIYIERLGKILLKLRLIFYEFMENKVLFFIFFGCNVLFNVCFFFVVYDIN